MPWRYGTILYECLISILIICSGDLSNWGWDDKESDMGSTCRSLGVAVYQLADDKVLEGWKAPESPKYKGMHGMQMPPREEDGYVGH